MRIQKGELILVLSVADGRKDLVCLSVLFRITLVKFLRTVKNTWQAFSHFVRFIMIQSGLVANTLGSLGCGIKNTTHGFQHQPGDSLSDSFKESNRTFFFNAFNRFGQYSSNSLFKSSEQAQTSLLQALANILGLLVLHLLSLAHKLSISTQACKSASQAAGNLVQCIESPTDRITEQTFHSFDHPHATF